MNRCSDFIHSGAPATNLNGSADSRRKRLGSEVSRFLSKATAYQERFTGAISTSCLITFAKRFRRDHMIRCALRLSAVVTLLRNCHLSLVLVSACTAPTTCIWARVVLNLHLLWVVTILRADLNRIEVLAIHAILPSNANFE